MEVVEQQEGSRARTYAKVTLVLVVAGLVFAAQRAGLLRQFSDPAQVRETMLGLGGLGYLAYLVAYTTLQPFGVPGTVFVIAASLIWPWPIAFALSMTGTMAASVVGFSFARFVARDFIAKRIPESFRKYDDALAKRAFVTVVVLRFIFWMPPLLHAFFGVSKVPFGTHFWGSLVGYIVPLLLVSFFGQKLLDLMTNAPWQAWVAMPALLVLGGGFWYWRTKRKSRPPVDR